MSTLKKIAELEDEIRKLKDDEKKKHAYTHAEEVVRKYPYHLSRDDGVPKKMEIKSVAEGAWEFGYNQYGFPAYFLDYGTGGAEALASDREDKDFNKKLAKLSNALDDMKYLFSENGWRPFKEPKVRLKEHEKRLKALAKAAREFGWDV